MLQLLSRIILPTTEHPMAGDVVLVLLGLPPVAGPLLAWRPVSRQAEIADLP